MLVSILDNIVQPELFEVEVYDDDEAITYQYGFVIKNISNFALFAKLLDNQPWITQVYTENTSDIYFDFDRFDFNYDFDELKIALREINKQVMLLG